jgi:hypothetical protein
MLFATHDIVILFVYVEDKLADVILVLLHVMEEANVPELTPVIFVKFVSLEGLSATGVELYVSNGEL